MAADEHRRIYKSDDATWVQIIDQIVQVLREYEPRQSFFAADQIEIEQDEDIELAKTGRYALSKATVRISKPLSQGQAATFEVVLSRSALGAGPDGASTIYDSVALNLNPRGSSWMELSSEIVLINEILARYGNPAIALGTAEAEEKETLRQLISGFGLSQQQMLANLNDQLTGLADRRKDLEDLFAKKEDERLQAHKEALDELDKQRRQMLRESHRSERRRLLNDTIAADAAELRRTITPTHVRGARWAVFAAAVLTSIVAGAFAVESMLAIGRNTFTGPQLWYLLLRSVISSVVTIGGLVYAANWLRSFYEEEVSAARDIDRFNYDMIRASWAIETYLEVKKEHNADMPPEWIQGVTKGLFETSSRTSTMDDSTRALRALMGFTASGSFGPNGAQIDINGKGARRLAKADGAGDAE